MRSPTRPILLATLAAFSSLPDARADEVDDFVLKTMERRHVPAVALAVVEDGELVKSAGYGKASLELDATASADSVFEIGSITKQFTSMAVMMLMEEGKVGLDDPIRDHLDGLPERWSGVTVRHLLNHTSGIKSYTSVADMLKLSREEHTPEEMLAIVRDLDPDFAPGEQWSYNNTGYFLLGLLIEKLAGQPYAAFLKARIFEPLGMDHTRANDPEAIIEGRVAGYAEEGGKLVNRAPLTSSTSFAAGCLVSTVGDLAKWDRALREGQFLKPESYEAMYAETRLKDGSTHNYGFGWGVERRDGKLVLLQHGGGTPGFSTMIWRRVDAGVTVIVLTNQGGGVAGEIAEGVARSFAPELPEAKPESADPDPDRTERLRGILAGILSDDTPEDELTPEFFKFITSPPARQLSKQLEAEGEIRRFTFFSAREKDGSTTLTYLVGLGEARFRVLFTLTPEGKLSGLLVRPG